MKKGYYIHEELYKDGELVFPGVQRKVDGQIKLLSSIADVEEVVLEEKPRSLYKLLMKRLPYGSSMYYWKRLYEKVKDPDFIYIRRVFADKGMMDFLKDMRRNYPKVKILIELPTYPYDKEQFGNLRSLPLLIKDHYNRNHFRKYVDRMVVLSRESEVFGLKTLKVHNGIDITDIPLRKHRIEDNKIRLITVATFQAAHGYERVIEGLASYYKRNDNDGLRDIEIHLVGDGTETELYHDIVKENRLDNRVFFHGRKTGADLDILYDNADIGLEIFGLYKRGLDSEKYPSSSLKSREYFSRGLPIVSGADLDIFYDRNEQYYLRFPNDSSPIDMDEVIGFYNEIYDSGKPYQEVINDIREFASENITWESTFREVISYLNGL